MKTTTPRSVFRVALERADRCRQDALAGEAEQRDDAAPDSPTAPRRSLFEIAQARSGPR